MANALRQTCFIAFLCHNFVNFLTFGHFFSEFIAKVFFAMQLMVHGKVQIILKPWSTTSLSRLQTAPNFCSSTVNCTSFGAYTAILQGNIAYFYHSLIWIALLQGKRQKAPTFGYLAHCAKWLFQSAMGVQIAPFWRQSAKPGSSGPESLADAVTSVARFFPVQNATKYATWFQNMPP